jgi:hypothetical protein
MNPEDRKEKVHDIGEWCNLQKINSDGVVQKYDLTPLQKNLNKPTDSYRDSNYKIQLRSSKGNDDQDYFINVCAPLAGFSHPSWDVNKLGYVAAWEENPDNSNRSHVLASVNGAQLESLRDNDLRMTMKDGSSCRGLEPAATRKVVIALTCSDVGLGDGPVFLEEYNTCEYTFIWNSCAACPLGHPYRNRNCGPGTVQTMTLPPFKTLFWLVVVLLGIYCVVGVGYNRIIGGARGVEQIPHTAFWSACCALPCAVCGNSAVQKPASTFINMHQGLIDDDEEDEVDDDAEDKLFD